MKGKSIAPPFLAGSVAALFLFQIDLVSSQVAPQLADSALLSTRDPGVRAGADAGGQLPGLSPNQAAFFASGATEFAAPEEVDEGLGPRMNLDSCGGCHIQPALGGPHPLLKPHGALAHKEGRARHGPTLTR